MYFTWLTFLAIVAVMISQYVVYNNDLACTSDGSHWIFRDCWARNAVFFVHQFSCMQCAATVRAVFVRDVRKIRSGEEYQNVKEKHDLDSGRQC